MSEVGFYDPTCGSGGLLLQCLARAREQGVNVRSLFLYGQELNPETWAIAPLRRVSAGISPGQFTQGLVDPKRGNRFRGRRARPHSPLLPFVALQRTYRATA
jgi:N-6 DNA Methylase